MTVRIKDWANFQHYQDGKRKPDWIKLYRGLLDDIDWHELDAKASKALVMLWLLASENGGELPPMKKIAFRLRISESEAKSTISKLSHWLEQDASEPLAGGYQDACLEEKRKEEKENRSADAPPKRRTQLPEDWQPPPIEGFSSFEIQKEVPQFRDYHTAKGSVMKDWDAAFRTWMRNSRKFGGKAGASKSNVVEGSFRRELPPEPPMKPRTPEEQADIDAKLSRFLKVKKL